MISKVVGTARKHTLNVKQRGTFATRFGESVNPVTASQQEWMAEVLSPKSTESSLKGNAKPSKDLEAGVAATTKGVERQEVAIYPQMYPFASVLRLVIPPL
jgi:hypothetical protein